MRNLILFHALLIAGFTLIMATFPPVFPRPETRAESPVGTESLDVSTARPASTKGHSFGVVQ